jgi:uncharacterized protein (TIGR02145 family)
MSKNWFYIDNNSYKGPFSEEEMESFYEQGIVGKETPIWGGYGDKWVPLKYYGFHLDDGEEIDINAEKHPELVKQWPVWGFSAVVLVFAILCMVPYAEKLYWQYAIYAVLNGLFLKYDKKYLKKAGYSVRNAAVAVAFPPAYLWKRGRVLKKKPIVPIVVWSFAAIVGFVISSVGDDTMVDPRDGQEYAIVQIGNQVWMAENMRYVGEGESFIRVQGNDGRYEILYTWGSAYSACPEGWHLPTWSDFDELIKAAGGESVAGLALKSTEGWGENGNDGNGTDEFFFNARPIGKYGEKITCGSEDRQCTEYDYGGVAVMYWSDSQIEDYAADALKLYTKVDQAVLTWMDKLYYGSVRCVKGNPEPVDESEMDWTDESDVGDGENSDFGEEGE